MALVYSDRVKETSTTTGTGTYDLAGAATGFQGFVAGIGDTNTCYYCATDGTDWEVGLGTVTDAATDTLSRDSVLASSNADAAVDWSAGSKDVFVVHPASVISTCLIADGSVALSADWDIGDGRYIAADKIQARDAAGLALYDDGGAGIFVEDGGNVGIGTNEPDGKLHVNGSVVIGAADNISYNEMLYVQQNINAVQYGIRLSDDLEARSAYIYYGGSRVLNIWDGITGSGNIAIGGTSAANVGIGYSGASVNAGSGTLMVNGSVGIGSTAPDKKLEINTGAADDGIRISYNDADGSATDYAEFIAGADGDLTITTVDSDGAAGHIALMPDGNVGVGTTSPAGKLHVGETTNGSGMYWTAPAEVTTTDATETTLDTLATASDTAYHINAEVVATETVDHDEVASYIVLGTFRNDGGTLTLVDSIVTTVGEDTAGWDCAVDANGTDIRLRVTGAAATNINWHGVMKVLSVS